MFSAFSRLGQPIQTMVLYTALTAVGSFAVTKLGLYDMSDTWFGAVIGGAIGGYIVGYMAQKKDRNSSNDPK